MMQLQPKTIRHTVDILYAWGFAATESSSCATASVQDRGKTKKQTTFTSDIKNVDEYFYNLDYKKGCKERLLSNSYS